MHRIITSLIIGILGLLLTSCVGASPSPSIASTDDLENGCLPPIADFSYPLGENGEFPVEPTVLPPQPWELVSEIPGNSNYDDFELMLIASGDIWIGENSTNELTLYNEISGMWNEVESLDDVSISSLTLVSDAQGTVWLAASGKFPQFLYRYDQTTNRIEPVELDIDGRLSQHVVELRTDSEGTLWILVGDYDTYLVELYSYIPATQQTT